MAKDEKVAENVERAEQNAQELKSYFQAQKQDCIVTQSWGDDFNSQRFVFAKDGTTTYILDLARELLEDYTSEQIISRLEGANWKQVVESQLKRVPYFTSKGFTLRS